MTSIFVASVDYQVSSEELKALFEAYGSVNKVTIATDRETGKPRGFAFVEMPSHDEAQQAIDGLNGYQLMGRTIAVKEAEDRRKKPSQPPTDRPPRTEDRPRSNTPPPSANQEVPSDLSFQKKKKTKASTKKARADEGPRKRKMEAYRKSGKNRHFYDDDGEDFD
ncbi:MAG: hypothetical protein EP338_14455 [Bacteroidetes bacterium]|nr:MAG: hypothetical protein EP338_14455 [Bacteroidota bacterium]